MRSAFEAEGEIRGTDLLAALVALWREGASGTLQFSRSGATAGFDIAAGDVVRTASSDSRFDTAAILVRAGKLDQATLERLPVGQGGDRAAVALQTGVLTRREWRWGEKIRAVEVLSDLLTWLEGDYWFFRTGAQDASEFRLTIPRLVLELFLRSRDRNLILHYLGGADVPLARAAAFDAEFPSFGLTADAESVVQLIDGERTAEEIASEAPADAFAVEKLLAALVTLGLVHPEFAPGEEPPAAPPFPTDESADAVAATDESARASAQSQADGEEDDEDAEAATSSEDRNAGDAAPEPEPAPVEPVSAAPEPPPESAFDRRISDDDAEESLAGGSFEEASRADSYDDEYEDDEPEPGDEESGLDDQEFDRDAGAAPPRPSSPSPSFAGEEPPRLDAIETGGDRERELGDEPIRDASLAGEDSPAGEDSHAETPSDLLGLDEGAPAPSSPFERPLDSTTGVGGPERPRPRSGGVWLWVLALLAVAVIAAVLWRSHDGSGPGEAARGAAAPTTSPTAIELSATAAAPAEAAAPSPTAMRIGPTARPAAAAAVPSAAPARPTAPPTAAPPAAAARHATAPATAKTAPPAARPRSSAPAPPASDASRQTWVDRAEHDQRRYVQEGKARFAVQLELACEVPSLADAFQHDRPAGSMWVLATPYQGRTCFRVLWGRYSSREEASRGLARAPSFFSTPRNHPAVVPVR